MRFGRKKSSKENKEKNKNSNKSKFNNKKTVFNGIEFHSKKECEYYQFLLKLKHDGIVKEIELQPLFLLTEGFIHKRKENSLETITGGFEYRQIKGKIQDIKYIADFRVIMNDGKTVVIDVKSSKEFQDDVYRIKKKLFLKNYPDVCFLEVY